MQHSNFDDVGNFHEKMNLINVTNMGPGLYPAATFAESTQDLIEFRYKFMQEELEEFREGMAQKDIVQVADALIDLAYVVMGTAHFFGLPWQELWDEVQRSNMLKERALSDGSNSKRGSSFDVVKPEGWTAPDLRTILIKHGIIEE